MKNTIEINGKTYRCRNEELVPLEFYENCNHIKRLATREEALSLVLESEGE